MQGEALIDERVVGRKKVGERPILAHYAVEQQLGLTQHGLRERLVEIGIEEQIRTRILEILQMQPLICEVVGERL